VKGLNRRPNRSSDTVMAEAASQILRDLGHVNFCLVCSTVGMPGVEICSMCKGPAIPAREALAIRRTKSNP
jgi:hypothetical protein